MNYITKQTTNFVNTETGEVLGSINAFLNVLDNPNDYQLARDMATRLVGLECTGNYNKPIIVIATREFEDGKTIQVTATFKQLLDYTPGEEEEEENEEEEEEDKEEEEDEYNGGSIKEEDD